MKKFVSILLAVLFVLSAVSVMSFAEGTTEGTQQSTTPVEKIYVCDFCGASFATTKELQDHIDATFAVSSHYKACDNAENGCPESFHTRAAYDAHMKECAYYGYVCDNGIDKDGDGVADEICGVECKTKAEIEAHKKDCKYANDGRSDFEKVVDYLKGGNIIGALKILANLVIDFVKSDDFKKITDKVVAFVKGIDFNKIKSAVTDVVDKLPLDKVEDLIK